MRRLLSDLFNLVYRQDRLLTWSEMLPALVVVFLAVLVGIGVDPTSLD